MIEPSNETELRALLNGETGKLHWRELQRHYARGAVIRVAPALDLVEVALRLMRDDKAVFEAWLHAGLAMRADDGHAEEWAARGAVLWAVVVAPWVLVQETEAGLDRN